MCPNAYQATTFSVTATKLYVLVVTLSTQDIAKPLEQLASGFKRTINWNKYQLKVTTQAPNWYWDYLISQSFQVVNILFVLSFENTTDRTYHTKGLPTVKIMGYNVMIDEQNIFSQTVKNDLRTYDNIRKKMRLVKEMIARLVVH